MLESYVSQGLGRYMVFRTLPVYLVGVFTAVTVDRLDLNAVLALAVMALAHVIATNGRAAWTAVSPTARDPRPRSLVLYYSATSTLVAAAVLTSALTYQLWTALIPQPSEVVLALWTGTIAAVLAAYVQTFRRREPEPDELVARARNDMGEHLWQYAEESAWRHDCDSDLIRAILVAEVAQRPGWLRRLEYAKGRLVPRGSYGVAQMQADQPMSEAKSIDALAASLASYYPERDQYGALRWERLAHRLERHNRKVAFLEMVREVLAVLQPYPAAATEAKALDGRPIIEVQSVRRVGDNWILHGTASVFEANLAYITEGDEPQVTSFLTVSTGGPRRGRWTLSQPIATRRVWLYEPSVEETGATEDGRTDERTAFIDLDAR